MKILNTIKQFLKKEEIATEHTQDQFNYITFLVDKETKEPYIKINIQDLSNEDAKVYGEMLFDINSGLYQSSILDILVDFAKQDDKINKFIMDTIMSWHSLCSIKQEPDDTNIQKPWLKKPQISPIEFNKNAK